MAFQLHQHASASPIPLPRAVEPTAAEGRSDVGLRVRTAGHDRQQRLGVLGR
jgi:hypothetical protein